MSNIELSSCIRNTTVQPSQMNGGNITNVFDLQTMRTIKGRVELNTKTPPLIPEPPQTPVDFIINGGNPDILGPGSFIFKDTKSSAVQSLNYFSINNITVNIPSLPLINFVPSGYTGYTNRIYITFYYVIILIPNYNGHDNFIAFYDENFIYQGGSPYNPGDSLKMTFDGVSVSNELTNNSGVYFRITQYYQTTTTLYILRFTCVVIQPPQGNNYSFTNINTSPTIIPIPPGIILFNTYQVLDVSGNPIVLGPNDFIVAYAIINNSSNTDISSIENYYSLPLTPIDNSPVVQFVINPIPPVWDDLQNLWIPQVLSANSIRNITPTLTTGPVNNNGTYINSGFGQFGTLLSTSCGLDSWLQMTQSKTAFTIEGDAINPGAINITLIVLSI
jgi:hypothetical protein